MAGKTELAITQQRPWRRKWQPTSVFLPGKILASTDRGAWQATVHEGLKRVGRDLVPKQQKRTKQWQRTSVTRAAS